MNITIEKLKEFYNYNQMDLEEVAVLALTCDDIHVCNAGKHYLNAVDNLTTLLNMHEDEKK